MLSVSTIIPHAGGKEILRDCLRSLKDSKGINLETIIVNNGPVDDIDEDTLNILPDVQILRYECNLGFAAACNRGVEAASGKFVFLLNNDATVEPDAIQVLAESLENDQSASACQPKILSLINAGYFDYSSAAGGEMDRYGFPFARGRVFDTIETDSGQYDDNRVVFWGAGAALMIRREHYLASGGLEERFFAHMEEIDLLWRIRLMGYSTLAVSSAIAWHRGATTIRSGSFSKYFYNHRNSLAMLFRNYEMQSVIRYMPFRMILDGILMVYSVFKADFVRFWAVLRAECWFWLSLPYLIRTRKNVQRLRRISDKTILKELYPRSVVWQYFIRKRHTWTQLQDIRS